eukprot:1847418-Prymnesium_polylepis.1
MLCNPNILEFGPGTATCQASQYRTRNKVRGACRHRTRTAHSPCVQRTIRILLAAAQSGHVECSGGFQARGATSGEIADEKALQQQTSRTVLTEQGTVAHMLPKFDICCPKKRASHCVDRHVQDVSVGGGTCAALDPCVDEDKFAFQKKKAAPNPGPRMGINDAAVNHGHTHGTKAHVHRASRRLCNRARNQAVICDRQGSTVHYKCASTQPGRR